MMFILFLTTLFISYPKTTHAAATAALTHAPDESEQKCGICLSDIDSEEEEPLNAFECTHDEHCFHNQCISELFTSNPNAPCPLCRAAKMSLKPKIVDIAESPFDEATLIGLATLENLDRKGGRRSSHQEKPKNRHERKKGPSQSPQPPKQHRHRHTSFEVNFEINPDDFSAFRPN